MSVKSFILWLFTPIQKLLQRMGSQESLMTSEQVERCLGLIQEGDILLSYEKGRPTSVLIKGFYDHAAIVTIRETVMEAVGDSWIYDGDDKKYNRGGVREVDLREWLFKKDSVCIVRPLYKKKTKRKSDVNKNASDRALGYKGLDYDYQFQIGAEKVYCSELVYLCYAAFDPDFMNHIDGEILPIDYYKMCFDSPREDMFMSLIIEVKNQ